MSFEARTVVLVALTVAVLRTWIRAILARLREDLAEWRSPGHHHGEPVGRHRPGSAQVSAGWLPGSRWMWDAYRGAVADSLA